MLATLLPLLESLGAEGGAATSLGQGSGLGSTLGRLVGGSTVQPFGSQNDLSASLRQISDLSQSIADAREAMSQMREEHGRLGEKAKEDERLYGFRDPQEHQRMADLQQQQIQHARQVQVQQQQVEGLQARAAVTMDPALAAQENRRGYFQRAGAMAIGGQAISSFGPSVLRNLPGVQPAAEAMSFAGGTAGQIVNDMGSQAASSVSNIAGAAAQGAALGGPVGAGAAAVAATAVEIAKLPSKIRDWSESLLASQKTISRFDGQMAKAFAQREVSELKRNMASAAATGGSTADLSKNLDELYDVLRPLKDSITIVVSRELTSLVRVLNGMAPVLAGLAGATAAIADMFTGGVFDFKMELVKALADVYAQEAARARNQSAVGSAASAAFDRMRAEDPKKPRQAPRR